MKFTRLIVLLAVVLILLSVLAGCVETPQAANPWLDSEPSAPSTPTVLALTLPDGASFEAYYPTVGWVVSRARGEQASAGRFYGIHTASGQLLPMEFRSISVLGSFILAEHYEADSSSTYHLYNTAGQLLLSSDVYFSVQSLGGAWAAVYADGLGYLCHTSGARYFTDGIPLTTLFSVCDDTLLTYDTQSGLNRLWVLPDGRQQEGMLLLAQYDQSSALSMLTYLGNHRFLITQTVPDEQSPTHAEIIGGVRTNLKQTHAVYNARTGETKSVSTPLIIRSTHNAYTPSTSPVSYGFSVGYTALCVAELSTAGVVVNDHYVLVDGDLNVVYRFPQGVSPSALRYYGDVGYAGASLEGYAAALFSLDGQTLWRQDSPHHAMSFSSSRLVAAKGQQSVQYGVYDLDGQELFPFEYDYISPFYNGAAIARVGEQYYRLTTTATPLTAPPTFMEGLAYGLYVHAASEGYTVADFSGKSLAVVDEVHTLGRLAEGFYLYVTVAGVPTLLIFS